VEIIFVMYYVYNATSNLYINDKVIFTKNINNRADNYI
jgi:hypothetical protein